MLREHVRLIHHNNKASVRDPKKIEGSKGRSSIDVDKKDVCPTSGLKSNHIEIAKDNVEAEFWRPWEY